MPHKPLFDTRAHVRKFEEIFPMLTPDNALEQIAVASGIPSTEITGTSKTAHISFWRQALYYTLYEKGKNEKGKVTFEAIAQTHFPQTGGGVVRAGHAKIKDYLDAYGTRKP